MTMIHILDRSEIPSDMRNRYVDVSSGDATAATTGKWATSFFRDPKTTDAVLIDLQDDVIDTVSYNAWRYPTMFPGATPITNITAASATCTAAAPAGTNCGLCSATGGVAPLFWTLANTDGGRFQINSTTGQMTKTGVAVSAGARTVRVRAVDKNGYAFEKDITITVT